MKIRNKAEGLETTVQGIQNGVLLSVAGFTVHKSSVLPASVLHGFAAIPSAGVFASRTLTAPDGNTLLYQGIFTDEESGLVIGIKEGCDILKGSIRIGELIYGFEPAQGDGIIRLTA